MSKGDRGERRYVPASFFGIVLGLGGLANSWRVAHRVWGLPAWIGEAVFVVGTLVWAVLVLLYIRKWVIAVEQARAELRQPIQCCFMGLVGVATMLIAGGVLPHSRALGLALLAGGGIYTIGFGVWRTGGLWQGGRENTDTTPVLYLPTVAGSFVLATVAGAAGFADGAQYAFGAGLFSWLAVESVLIHRLYNAPALVPSLRPDPGYPAGAPHGGSGRVPGRHARRATDLRACLPRIRPVAGARARATLALDSPASLRRLLLGLQLRRDRAGDGASANGRARRCRLLS